MAILSHTIQDGTNGKKLVLYGETANINYFIKTGLAPDVIDGVKNITVSRSGGSRRQYPGDPTPISGGGGVAEYVVDPSRRSGSALPGRSIRLVADPGQINEEARVFTLVGRWIDFHAWLRLNAKMMIHAYNSSGARYTIPGPQPTP